MFAANQLVYFVFADASDTYYRESGLRLSLRELLHLRLREDGFQSIWFSDGAALRALSGESAPLWERRNEKRFLARKLREGEGDRKYLLRELKGKARTAIVMGLREFCQLFGKANAQPELEELTELASSPRGSVLVLLAPMEAEASAELLFGPDSLFCQTGRSGKALCPELGSVREGQSIGLYSQMRAAIGERYIVLNATTCPMKENKTQMMEELKALVHCAMLRRGELLRGQELDNVALVLYCALRSRRLRKELHLGDGNIKFATLYTRLTANEESWQKLLALARARASENGEVYIDDIRTDPHIGDLLECAGGVVWNHELTRRLDQMELPRWYAGSDNWNRARQELLEIRRQVHIPRYARAVPENLQYMEQFLTSFHDASQEKYQSAEYLEWTLEAMKFEAGYCMGPKGQEEIRSLFQDGLELARRYAQNLERYDVLCDQRERGLDEGSMAAKLRDAELSKTLTELQTQREKLAIQREAILARISQAEQGTAKAPKPAMTAEQAQRILQRYSQLG